MNQPSRTYQRNRQAVKGRLASKGKVMGWGVKGKKHCIAHIMVPINLMAVLCAFETWRARKNTDAALTLVFNHAYASDDLYTELQSILANMIAEYPAEIAIVSVDQSQLDLFSEGAPGDLKSHLEVDSCSAIFYAHDLSGECLHLLVHTYIHAELICVGDGLGSVILKDDHFSFLGLLPPKSKILQKINRTEQRRRFWNRRARRRRIVSGSIFPDVFMPILPVDQAGCRIPQRDLVVCEASIVKKVIERISRSCVRLQDYAAALAKSNPYFALMLPDNFADAGLMSLIDEVEMLCSALDGQSNPELRVIIKPHPNSLQSHTPAIVDRLGTRFQIVEIDREFWRYPVELWAPLLQQGTVIAPGHAALTLKYLFDVDVLMPLDENNVIRFARPEFKTFLIHAMEVTIFPLRNLPDWDGRKPLYIGASPAKLNKMPAE